VWSPSVQGAIDGTHISIVKSILCHENYYYHKLDGYSLVAQVVVDYKKKFTNVFVGFPRNLNDSRVLHKSTLYRKVENHVLFAYDPRFYQHWFPPYLLGDKGYPLITWIMTPFKEEGHHIVLELLYNMKHKQGHSIVENALRIIKKPLGSFLPN